MPPQPLVPLIHSSTPALLHFATILASPRLSSTCRASTRDIKQCRRVATADHIDWGGLSLLSKTDKGRQQGKTTQPIETQARLDKDQEVGTECWRSGVVVQHSHWRIVTLDWYWRCYDAGLYHIINLQCFSCSFICSKDAACS
jgi:hypothetical protein